MACHPNEECPVIFCAVKVKRFCPCGRHSVESPCGSDDPPVQCTDACRNYKRFAALYEAEEALRNAYFSRFLVRFGRSNPEFLQKIEEKLAKMFFEAQPFVKLTVPLTDEKKAQFIQALAVHHYKLDSDLTATENGLVVKLSATPDSIVPRLVLSSYLAQGHHDQNSRPLPFEVFFEFFNLTVLEKPSDLRELLKEFKDKFYLEESTYLTAMFYKEEDADAVAKILKTHKSRWSDFAVIKPKKEEISTPSQPQLKPEAEEIKGTSEKEEPKASEDDQGWDLTPMSFPIAPSSRDGSNEALRLPGNRNRNKNTSQVQNIFSSLARD